jgi:MFS transporter, SET family, sugar efflux transporter
MLQGIIHILKDRDLRLATLAVFCIGLAVAATGPYISLIGIQQLGLSTGRMALLSAMSAVMVMVGTVFMGFMSDRTPNRKRGVMLSLGFGLFGYSGFYFFPGPWTLAIFLLLIMPVSGASNPQLFAIIRDVSNRRAASDAAAINAAARSTFALAWIVVPGLVGAYIAISKNVSDSFAVAAAAFFLCIAAYGLFGAPGGKAEPSKTSVLQGLKEALVLVASKAIAPRIAALALIACVQPSNLALLPLIVTQFPDGNTQSIGLIAGLTAALEVPLMLFAGYLGGRMPIWKLIVAGGVVYACYLGLVGMAQSVNHLYGLAALNALGNAIMFAMHLSYFQNLLPDRPGLGTSLLSISQLFYRLIGAGVLALAGTTLGLAGAAMVGAGLALCGVIALVLLDQSKAKA